MDLSSTTSSLIGMSAARLLAAEYWCPDVLESWCDPVLLDAANEAALHDGHEIEVAFAGIYDEQDARCWYYLLLAAEFES